jgi:hypothetical protein
VHIRHLALALATAILLFWQVSTASATPIGSIFVTGHDPDYHSVQGGNALGAQHIIQEAIAFTTNGAALGAHSLLLVTDLRNPGGDESDSRLGLNASGFGGDYDVADYGSGTPGVLDLHSVNFSNYAGIVVASDYGGWLRQDELDILNARSSDILSYVNGGGGLFAMAEGGDRAGSPPIYNGTTHDRFGFLPFLVADAPLNQGESGNTLTPFGLSLGLVNSDVNGNASHNVFTATGGMNVVDMDPSNEILSLAFRGNIGPNGVPEPSSITLLLVGGLALLGKTYRRRK